MGEKALECNLRTIRLRDLNAMKELTFLYQRLFPLTLNVRILKLWNPAVCSVFTYLLSIATQSLKGGIMST
jgi:hypothetical protein